MQIGKSDVLTLKLARIQEKNPLGKIDLVLELLYLDDSYLGIEATTGAAKVHEKLVFEAMTELFKGRFLNKGE